MCHSPTRHFDADMILVFVLFNITTRICLTEEHHWTKLNKYEQRGVKILTAVNIAISFEKYKSVHKQVGWCLSLGNSIHCDILQWALRIFYVGMLYCGFWTEVGHICNIAWQVTYGLICADPGSVSPTFMAIFRMQYYSVWSQASSD